MESKIPLVQCTQSDSLPKKSKDVRSCSLSVGLKIVNHDTHLANLHESTVEAGRTLQETQQSIRNCRNGQIWVREMQQACNSECSIWRGNGDLSSHVAVGSHLDCRITYMRGLTLCCTMPILQIFHFARLAVVPPFKILNQGYFFTWSTSTILSCRALISWFHPGFYANGCNNFFYI